MSRVPYRGSSSSSSSTRLCTVSCVWLVVVGVAAHLSFVRTAAVLDVPDPSDFGYDDHVAYHAAVSNAYGEHLSSSHPVRKADEYGAAGGGRQLAFLLSERRMLQAYAREMEVQGFSAYRITGLALMECNRELRKRSYSLDLIGALWSRAPSASCEDQSMRPVALAICVLLLLYTGLLLFLALGVVRRRVAALLSVAVDDYKLQHPQPQQQPQPQPQPVADKRNLLQPPDGNSSGARSRSNSAAAAWEELMRKEAQAQEKIRELEHKLAQQAAKLDIQERDRQNALEEVGSLKKRVRTLEGERGGNAAHTSKEAAEAEAGAEARAAEAVAEAEKMKAEAERRVQVAETRLEEMRQLLEEQQRQQAQQGEQMLALQEENRQHEETKELLKELQNKDKEHLRSASVDDIRLIKKEQEEEEQKAQKKLQESDNTAAAEKKELELEQEKMRTAAVEERLALKEQELKELQELYRSRMDPNQLSAADKAKEELLAIEPFIGLKVAECKTRQVGVTVSDIFEHTPAEAAGIEVGDILEKIDSTECRTTKGVKERLSTCTPGQSICCQVLQKRNGYVKNHQLLVGGVKKIMHGGKEEKEVVNMKIIQNLLRVQEGREALKLTESESTNTLKRSASRAGDTTTTSAAHTLRASPSQASVTAIAGSARKKTKPTNRRQSSGIPRLSSSSSLSTSTSSSRTGTPAAKAGGGSSSSSNNTSNSSSTDDSKSTSTPDNSTRSSRIPRSASRAGNSSSGGSGSASKTTATTTSSSSSSSSSGSSSKSRIPSKIPRPQSTTNFASPTTGDT